MLFQSPASLSFVTQRITFAFPLPIYPNLYSSSPFLASFPSCIAAPIMPRSYVPVSGCTRLSPYSTCFSPASLPSQPASCPSPPSSCPTFSPSPSFCPSSILPSFLHLPSAIPPPASRRLSRSIFWPWDPDQSLYKVFLKVTFFVRNIYTRFIFLVWT